MKTLLIGLAFMASITAFAGTFEISDNDILSFSECNDLLDNIDEFMIGEIETLQNVSNGYQTNSKAWNSTHN